MGVKERREREKLEIRDLILDAARDLFISEGYAGVSMRKVADRIEYSPTSIYLHFADKDELFHELCHRDFAKLAEDLNQLVNEPDVLERIRQIGLAYIQFGVRYPNHYQLMFMTAHPFKEMNDFDLEVKGNPEKDAYAMLRIQVQQGIDAGAFRDEFSDADAIAQTLWAAVHGVISLQIAKGTDGWVDWKPLEERARMMTNAILYGLLKPKGTEKM